MGKASSSMAATATPAVKAGPNPQAFWPPVHSLPALLAAAGDTIEIEVTLTLIGPDATAEIPGRACVEAATEAAIDEAVRCAWTMLASSPAGGVIVAFTMTEPDQSCKET